MRWQADLELGASASKVVFLAINVHGRAGAVLGRAHGRPHQEGHAGGQLASRARGIALVARSVLPPAGS